MSVVKEKVLYTRIEQTKEACVGRIDESKNAISRDFVGEVVILSRVFINGVYCTVTTLGRYAFDSCPGLTNVVIPNTVTLLKDSCFCRLNITNPIIIPSSVKTVESFFIDNWNPSSIIFCGKEEPKMVIVENFTGWISRYFTGVVTVSNDYEKDTFCLKNIEKRLLTECSIIQKYLALKLYLDQNKATCFKNRKRYHASLLVMNILMIT